MDCLTLLAEARAAGLTVAADGERLVVRGPRNAEALALRLLQWKAEAMAALAAEQTENATNSYTLKNTPETAPKDMATLPGRWRERIVQRRGGPVRILERVDPPPQFPWLVDVEFDDLPDPWLPDRETGKQAL